MTADGRAFTRTYGLAAGLLVALAAAGGAVALTTGPFVPALGAAVVSPALAMLVLSVGIVHRPRAFLAAFGDAATDRRVLAVRLTGALGVAVSLLVLAAGVEAVRNLPQASGDAGRLP